MKKLFVLLALCVVSTNVVAQNKPMKEFVDELMSKMTLKEKLGQLNLLPAGNITTGAAQNNPIVHQIKDGELGGVFNIKGLDEIRTLQEMAIKKSRLGIPLLVGMDVIHGYETIFPVPLALACSWNLEGIENSARVAALEASAEGVNWTYSPMVDISRDARWGRIVEGAGEDPYLGSLIAKAMVKGYQGDYSLPSNIMACVKHFALYGASEAGRDYNTVDMSRLRMYNEYFAPYKAAVEVGVGSVMTSFNLVDGIPATANAWLVNDVLRKQWGFDGFVVTDYASIHEMTTHGVGDLATSSARALRAGTDMDMVAKGFIGTLEQSLANGQVSMADINQACRRVLEAKYKLGLFKDPYKYVRVKNRNQYVYTAANRKAARDLAAETFVLLKNENQVLPLKKQGKIALIGPLANDRANLCGTWCVAMAPERYSTLKESMERALKGKAQLLYAQGCNIASDDALQKAGEQGKNIMRVDDAQAKAEALAVAAQADVIIAAMGEAAEFSGESHSRVNLELPDVQMALLKELVATGKPVVLLNFSGRPTILNWEKAHVPAILNVWFGGSEAGDAICDVVFGDKNPCGKLTTSFPQHVGQIPLYYNHFNTGRPVADGADRFFSFQSNYLDVRNDPLYPFGYGLSYTTYQYGELKLDSKTMSPHGQITVTIPVTNTGNRDGIEVVQLYIRDVVGSIARPVKELKGFQRLSLKAGETATATFTIDASKLKFYNYDLKEVVEPGEFDVMVGPNSRDLKRATITVQ
ncbi:beta-glucosidase BglX [Hoylesella buccalis]|uniref:beta-glucosidase BglX n=1 Tax=Hoylesella buccalis TaxID=28127 RepID=UPI001D07D246|nr:beta-glucosidase BglX [Hoylesella buccalis]MCB6901365.1 beta-glucosidase BglX [Hoylesella buccalis]UEA61827.1 beta-glucosidase BglX [Hoylesella buccalis]UWP48456.1 beta-glucosidase BglX [Hoylesella buccalis ATCC 35310]